MHPALSSLAGIADDPFRFAVLVVLGVGVVGSHTCAGYGLARKAGTDPDIGACVGMVVGVAVGLAFLS